MNSLISNGRSKKISSIRFAPEFSLFGANYLFPFFLFGLGCSRFRIAKIDFLPIYIAVLVGTSSYAIAGILGYVARTDRVSIIALLLGVSACFSLLLSGWKNRTLAFIGFYSYTIYLFHVFFTASTRMFLYSMNLKNITALVIVATVAGVVGPILVEMIADRCVDPDAAVRKSWPGRCEDAMASDACAAGVAWQDNIRISRGLSKRG